MCTIYLERSGKECGAICVEECKRVWKNLRDAYRAEVKRIELRIEKDIRKGSYDPNSDYSSKWSYFEAMQFIKHHDVVELIKLRIHRQMNRLVG
ncbi:uncharacterized protein LOC119608749 [Lucilia sericata]|uniref:uncharacterized protein LOC119608749 n=1 Tax=Lucilia sericata TaxID=13632 RepID=UPI0018A81222|nr:uncharacterized protein LOC119608749 [Lucilia sericata]